MLWSNSWIKGKILMLETVDLGGFRDFFHFSLLFRFAFFLFVPRFFCVTRVYLNLSLLSICLVTLCLSVQIISCNSPPSLFRTERFSTSPQQARSEIETILLCDLNKVETNRMRRSESARESRLWKRIYCPPYSLVMNLPVRLSILPSQFGLSKD